MPEFATLKILTALPLAGAISIAMIWIIAKTNKERGRRSQSSTTTTTEFVIRNDRLINADPEVLSLAFLGFKNLNGWSALRAWLGTRFGPLPTALDEVKPDTNIKLPAAEKTDEAVLSIGSSEDGHHIRLSDACSFDAAELHRARALDATLQNCIGVLENVPCALRCEHLETGQVWQNAAFSSFDSEDVDAILKASETLTTVERFRLEGKGKNPHRFYRLHSLRHGDISSLYVVDTTEVVQVELLRGEFVQTLTKTFANLTTGLVVFDRHRKLALFNPALVDLTRLPAAALSIQPTITQFFDRLRENKILPEPKNYHTWRNQIDEMITSASDGLYLEDWSLPNGETYRVAGRPHPDGAVAFLFEDISDEVSLTRRFRSQIEVRQAALDGCDQAIAIIGPTNVVLLCNLPASVMLGIDPDASFAEMSIQEFLQVCSEMLPDDGFWAEVDTKILGREAAEAVISSAAGIPYLCKMKPIRGNCMLISFSTPIAEPGQGSEYHALRSRTG